MTHSNMLQTAHEHLTALERSVEQANKAASNAVPRASVHTTVAASATHRKKPPHTGTFVNLASLIMQGSEHCPPLRRKVATPSRRTYGQ
jgi:hypothetical protein